MNDFQLYFSGSEAGFCAAPYVHIFFFLDRQMKFSGLNLCPVLFTPKFVPNRFSTKVTTITFDRQRHPVQARQRVSQNFSLAYYHWLSLSASMKVSSA